jgi:hypothetical protein
MEKPWRVPAIVGFGIGAAGIALGSATGVIAMNQTSAIRARCGGDSCPASEADAVSAAKGMATASTVGFALAGAGVATGVILLVVKPGQRLKVGVGPTSAHVTGVF